MMTRKRSKMMVAMGLLFLSLGCAGCQKAADTTDKPQTTLEAEAQVEDAVTPAEDATADASENQAAEEVLEETLDTEAVLETVAAFDSSVLPETVYEIDCVYMESNFAKMQTGFYLSDEDAGVITLAGVKVEGQEVAALADCVVDFGEYVAEETSLSVMGLYFYKESNVFYLCAATYRADGEEVQGPSVLVAEVSTDGNTTEIFAYEGRETAFWFGSTCTYGGYVFVGCGVTMESEETGMPVAFSMESKEFISTAFVAEALRALAKDLQKTDATLQDATLYQMLPVAGEEDSIIFEGYLRVDADADVLATIEIAVDMES